MQRIPTTSIHDLAPTGAPSPFVVQSISGPDCSAPILLAPGRHEIGRAPTACLRFDDQALELHHATLIVSKTGTATAHQLSGRTPMLVDGRPRSAPVTLSSGNIVRLGTTDLLIGRPTDAPRRRWATSDATDRRTGRPGQTVQTGQPTYRPRATTTTAMTAVFTVVLTVVFGTSHVGTITHLAGASAIATATWAVATTARHRRIRAVRRSAAAAEIDWLTAEHDTHEAARQAHLDRHRPFAVVLADVDSSTTGAPQRHDPVAGDRPEFVVGVGRPPWVFGGSAMTTDHRTAVAITWTLQPATATKLVGDRRLCLSLVRAVLIQLAIACDPSEWAVAIESDLFDDWEWAEWLPHARRPDGRFAIHTIGPGPNVWSARTLLVVDDSTAQGDVVDAAVSTGCAVIVITSDDRTTTCDRAPTLRITTTGTARWDDGNLAAAFAITGLGALRAAGVARQLALRVGPDPHAERHPPEESPSNQRGPAPKRAAESSAL